MLRLRVKTAVEPNLLNSFTYSCFEIISFFLVFYEHQNEINATMYARLRHKPELFEVTEEHF